MKRILAFGGGVLLIAAFVAVIVLNPGEVDFRPTHIHSFRPMLGVLLIIAFSTGAALALFGGSLRSISAALSNWSSPSAKSSTEDAHSSIPSSHASARSGITLAVLLPGSAPPSVAIASDASADRAPLAAERRSLALARSSSGSTW